MRYIIRDNKDNTVFTTETLQSVGDWIFDNSPKGDNVGFYVLDTSPTFYPFNTYHYDDNGNLVGTMHKTLDDAYKAMKG